MSSAGRKVGLLVAGHLLAVVAGEALLRVSYPLYRNYNTEMWRYATTLKRKTPENPALRSA